MRHSYLLFAMFALLVSSADAQVRSPGAYRQSDGTLVLIMPPATSARQIRSSLEYTDNAVEYIGKALCVEIGTLNQQVRSASSANDFLKQIAAAPQCELYTNRYNGATRSVTLVMPTDTTTFRKRSRSSLAVNTSPFVKGGFNAQLDTLASQAKQKLYQDRLRNHAELSPEQSEEIIRMLQNKQCGLTELPSGTYLAKNYGVQVSGQNIQYVHKDGDPAVMIARCELSDGAIVYIGEFCSNVYFPLQSVVYHFSPLKAEAPRVIAAPQPVVVNKLEVYKRFRVVGSKDTSWTKHTTRGINDVSVGDRVEYHITVRNSGNTPARVWMRDVMDKFGLEPFNVQYNDLYQESGQFIGTLRPGESRSVFLTATVTADRAKSFDGKLVKLDSLPNIAEAWIEGNRQVYADTATVVLKKKGSKTPLYVLGVGAGVCAITYFVHIPPCGSKKKPEGNKPEGGGPIVRFQEVGPMSLQYGAPPGPPLLLDTPARLPRMTNSGKVDFSVTMNIQLVRIPLGISKLF